jgi:hypothetical protein
MTTTTTDVQDAQADAAAAKNAVAEAEADLLSGKRSISADLLHKVTDRWRHADLTAQRARLAAEEERRSTRLKGLEAIGAEVDKLAQPEHSDQLADAMRDIAAACARFHLLAQAHDADLADLVAAATDLRAEPAALAGPRETSSYVAVKGDTIAHRRVVLTPLAGHVRAALAHAMNGDINQAVTEIRTATKAVPEPRRPDHLLRNVRSGNIVEIYGPLTDGMKAQLRSSNPRSGELDELSDHDIDLYMEGELA